MGIKKQSYLIIPALIILGLGLNCIKTPLECPKFGYEFTYNKPGAYYSPGVDSFPLGGQLILEATAPKSFFDEE